jgi:holo-[acyl-carrier protein] synthase
MIYGIGVDLVKIDRIEKVIKRWGDRFINRVFTPDEREFCLKRVSPYSAFALRFAAKEAFSKALGTGMRKGVAWRDIEVFHFKGGRPGLKIHGESQTLFRNEEINSCHVSLSDEKEYGVAVVILERQ